jgi:hypothetical protein
MPRLTSLNTDPEAQLTTQITTSATDSTRNAPFTNRKSVRVQRLERGTAIFSDASVYDSNSEISWRG